MAKIRLEIELEYDADVMHGDDADSQEWFRRAVLHGSGADGLILHSNCIGDEVGTVTVLREIT